MWAIPLCYGYVDSLTDGQQSAQLFVKTVTYDSVIRPALGRPPADRDTKT